MASMIRGQRPALIKNAALLQRTAVNRLCVWSIPRQHHHEPACARRFLSETRQTSWIHSTCKPSHLPSIPKYARSLSDGETASSPFTDKPTRRSLPSQQFSRQTRARQIAMTQLGLSGPPSIGRSISRTLPKQRRRRQQSRHPQSPSLLDQEEEHQIFQVQAIHIAQTINLYPVISNVFAGNAVKKQMFGKASVCVQLSPMEHDHNDENPIPRYVAIFRFGSVVAVNLSAREITALVEDIKKYAVEPVLSGFERKESFGILLQALPTPGNHEPSHHQEQHEHLSLETDLRQQAHPSTATGEASSSTASSSSASASFEEDEPMGAVTGEYCVVPELDMNGVAVIANIMAQTVALDTYNDAVDDLLSDFARINSTVTRTGTFDDTDRVFLFKSVAQNNSIFIDMISKIRIKDRSDTAWNLTKYETIHYGMKEEFEIDERFDHIEFKLNLIQQNAKFFLEVMQHQKSNSIEWILVVLVGAECILMCVDMSGMGGALFASLSKALY